jgi:carboxypeptidase D
LTRRRPVGTGFSQGTPTAASEADVAAQFMGFWKNVVDTFALRGFTVYITGESYAGYYVPYIADAFFNANDTEYYNISSIMIYDPSLNSDAVQQQIPAVPFVDYWGPLLSLNETFTADIHKRADACNYTSFIDEYLAFPPDGPLPTPPNVNKDVVGCDLWTDIYYAAITVNPCFDIYQVATTCPLLYDVLGFPGSFDYLPYGTEVYFNRSDVQTAINAPRQNWAECTSVDVFVNGTDNSPPSALSVLPSVIDRAERVIIAHGLLDYILIYNGSLLAIQNMTFGGSQGFSSPPEDDFIVPNLHPELSLSSLAGSGVMGKYHTEKKLTLVTITLSGHMVPQYAPGAAYRQMEFLLGRIPSLGEAGNFTTQMDKGGAYGPFKASPGETTCTVADVC